MKITSKTELYKVAENIGYRAEILEKVLLLLELSSQLMASKKLRDTLVLKGGTAINIFCTENLPRLSVDLDFNYIGSINKSNMLEDKQIIRQEIIEFAILSNMSLIRNPSSHAGGKMIFEYKSLIGSKGRIEVDINYMYRIPLWDITYRNPVSWLKQVTMPVLDIHEIAAGKLSALFDRKVSRDLYDTHQLLTNWDLNYEKLRIAFVLYIAMSKNKWQEITFDKIGYDVKDIKNRLIPVLHRGIIANHNYNEIEKWAIKIVNECKEKLLLLLPFSSDEQIFLELFQQKGMLKPELICEDVTFCAKVKDHPLLRWRLTAIRQGL